MGLDMYINNDNNEEVAYWRKHWDLHNAFEKLATHKGIEFDSFNCVPVPLEPGDLEYVESVLDIEYDDKTAMYYTYTNDILTHCKFLIGTGAKLTYDSWW